MARPVLPWRSPMEYLPQSGAYLWIRRLPWYDRPVVGMLKDDAAVYYTTNWNAGYPEPLLQEIPWTAIHSWKFKFQADETSFRAVFPDS